jgi:hypothetical protein
MSGSFAQSIEDGGTEAAVGWRLRDDAFETERIEVAEFGEKRLRGFAQVTSRAQDFNVLVGAGIRATLEG